MLAGIAVAQDHVGLAAAAEIAEARELPIEPDRAQERGGDDIVADAIELEAAGARVAQQHGGVAAAHAAEAVELPIGSDLTQLIARQDGVVADVVNLVLARHGGGRVRAAQDHAGGRARGRSWVRRDREQEPMIARHAAVVANDLAHIVDARCTRDVARRGIVEGGVGAAAEQEAVHVADAVGVAPGDLAGVVDAECSGGPRKGHGIVEGGVAAAAEEEAVKAAAVLVRPHDLAHIVDAHCTRADGARGRVIEGGVAAAVEEEAVPVARAVGVPPTIWPVALMPDAPVPLVAKGSLRVV